MFLFLNTCICFFIVFTNMFPSCVCFYFFLKLLFFFFFVYKGAWCASSNVCLTVSDVFTQNCRGTVFDVPCPASFVGVNRVIGNLVVEQDPIFGGGHLQVSGSANASSNKFRLTINSTESTLLSANKIQLLAGDNAQTNSPGGSVSIGAGSGTNVNRGAGGSIALQADCD